jgi:uncharacterized protein YfdQ (DUF2303 family)
MKPSLNSPGSVQTIAELARQSQAPLPLGVTTDIPTVVIGGEIHELEEYLIGRVRFRGNFSTSVIADFAEYVALHGGGEGFIDPKSCAARVYINLGTSEKPGHGDWTANIKMEPTAAYAAILGANGKRMEQRAIVEWVEDWSASLGAITAGGEAVSIASVLPALRELTITQKRETTSTDRDMGATRTAMEDIEAKSREGIPTHITFRAVPYIGFAEREFRLRLSIITGDKPQIALRVVGIEGLVESIGNEFKQLLQDAVGDKAKLLLGTFST